MAPYACPERSRTSKLEEACGTPIYDRRFLHVLGDLLFKFSYDRIIDNRIILADGLHDESAPYPQRPMILLSMILSPTSAIPLPPPPFLLNSYFQG
jgi:hypothetical protein